MAFRDGADIVRHKLDNLSRTLDHLGCGTLVRRVHRPYYQPSHSAYNLNRSPNNLSRSPLARGVHRPCFHTSLDNLGLTLDLALVRRVHRP
jgi:hypothetical protein